MLGSADDLFKINAKPGKRLESDEFTNGRFATWWFQPIFAFRT